MSLKVLRNDCCLGFDLGVDVDDVVVFDWPMWRSLSMSHPAIVGKSAGFARLGVDDGTKFFLSGLGSSDIVDPVFGGSSDTCFRRR